MTIEEYFKRDEPAAIAQLTKFWEKVYCSALIGNITADVEGVGRTSELGLIADAAVNAWRLRFDRP